MEKWVGRDLGKMKSNAFDLVYHTIMSVTSFSHFVPFAEISAMLFNKTTVTPSGKTPIYSYVLNKNSFYPILFARKPVGFEYSEIQNFIGTKISFSER